MKKINLLIFLIVLLGCKKEDSKLFSLNKDKEVEKLLQQYPNFSVIEVNDIPERVIPKEISFNSFLEYKAFLEQETKRALEFKGKSSSGIKGKVGTASPMSVSSLFSGVNSVGEFQQTVFRDYRAESISDISFMCSVSYNAKIETGQIDGYNQIKSVTNMISSAHIVPYFEDENLPPPTLPYTTNMTYEANPLYSNYTIRAGTLVDLSYSGTFYKFYRIKVMGQFQTVKQEYEVIGYTFTVDTANPGW